MRSLYIFSLECLISLLWFTVCDIKFFTSRKVAFVFKGSIAIFFNFLWGRRKGFQGNAHTRARRLTRKRTRARAHILIVHGNYDIQGEPWSHLALKDSCTERFREDSGTEGFREDSYRGAWGGLLYRGVWGGLLYRGFGEDYCIEGFGEDFCIEGFGEDFCVEGLGRTLIEGLGEDSCIEGFGEDFCIEGLGRTIV